MEKSERKSAGREAQIRKYKKENIIIKIQIGKNRKQSTGGKVRAETVSRQACMKPRRKETVGRLPASCAWFGTAGGLPASCAWFEPGGRLPHGSAFRHAADKFSKTEPSARENHVQKVK